MSTISAHLFAVDPSLDWETDLCRARMLAKLLDAQFSVAGFRFGIDALIDLVPIGGDVIGTVLGLYPLYLARKHQLGRTVALRMAWNLGIEFVGEAIPIVGSVFDAAYRANLKNVALLEKAASRKRF